MKKSLVNRLCVAGALLLTFVAIQSQAESPESNDRDLTGENGILFWGPDQQVYGFPRLAELYPTRSIQGQEVPLQLPIRLSNLDAFSYSYAEQIHTVDSHMQSERTAGLLVIQNGEIKVERYGLEHHANAPWVSFSVTKSVVSMLFGAAVKDGYIASIDDPVSDYLPVFEDSPYADVSIKHILQMASGVAWNEDYADPASNIVNLPGEEMAGFKYMRNLPRVAKPGTVFNYNTGETNIAGAILRKAVGKNLSDYASEKVFLPGGISNTANWLLGAPNGNEFAGCCISANLRDYGRIGLFALQNSQASSPSSPLAPNWMQQSTTPSPGYDGYGFFWWLTDSGVYSAQGVFGQFIFVDANRDLVIVLQSAWPEAWNTDLENRALSFIGALADYVVAGD
ncbi:MAG: class A beta-lactamase-related serine hydrolase [Gammaproteobacteria bacterium TMED57]|jgi:CubicO group peptidase (beta-lactamase class C family)|nr:MAG: class A beta-lactamase-related serine hydrolase [Gammaproteobacteria bacterium TMED57]|tara:strand:- start:1070 stop:2257 length:1188 start_codon:yes stop_codon:yes gene_type:complete